MKKTIYIFISSYCVDPVVFTSFDEAKRQVDDEINYLKERYRYDDDEIKECYDELNQCNIESGYFGTYLGDTNIDVYIREIEI